MFKNLILSTFLSLRAHKLRVFLTMVGIIIGIAAVVTVSAIGEGMKQSSLKMMESTNSNVIKLIFREEVGEDDDEVAQNYEPFNFTRNDLKQLQQLENVKGIAGSYGYGMSSIETISANIQYFTSSGGTEIVANQGDNKVAYGRDITPADVNENVIVLAHDTLQYGLGTKNPANIVGRAIDVDGEKFLVIGVKKEIDFEGGISTTFDENDFYSVVPKKAYNQLTKSKPMNAIKITIQDGADRESIIMQANDLLKEAHPDLIGEFEEDKSNEQMRQEVEKMIQQVVIGLVMITAISLLVGGIGVMNIMYVSVTERKREIGIRRAIGARPSNILLQFLMEAAFITLIGGLIGILLGWLIAQGLSSVFEIEAIVSLKMTLISASVSTAIGLVFGIIPAFNAAKIDPIKAIYQ
ncbi:ABC transporter permease [Vagococcus lutrae]|uniref:ABC transporter permease n=1 Tax=Vagococcus lutrae TaxID=81947 RepID=UPI00288F7D77|nr:ABC transporter permease [Vagococcus lutrae]MDT2823806.1 ABC transporter permease [Vagococcus lutrae]